MTLLLINTIPSFPQTNKLCVCTCLDGNAVNSRSLLRSSEGGVTAAIGIEVTAFAPVKRCDSGGPVVQQISVYYSTMDGMKFDSVQSETQENKYYNVCECEGIVNRMKEREKHEVKKTQKDYLLLRKYDII